MFAQMNERLIARMRYLEAIDAKDRIDSTPQAQRLRQIGADTGRFLALLAANTPPGQFLEIGTSAGYSALWISVACCEAGRRLTTMESDPAKVRLAEETFRQAGVESLIDLRPGDARQLVIGVTSIAFCFLDAAKDIYQECYEALVPVMVRGGLLVADNIITHKRELAAFVDHAQDDVRVDSLVVPLGNGLLLCRKT